MANDLTTRPWLLDTIANPIQPAIFTSAPGAPGAPGSFGTNLAPATQYRRACVQGFVYYGVNPGDTATFQDYRGRQVAKLFCVTANQPVGEANFIKEGNWYNGLALTQISSGYVEVYVR